METLLNSQEIKHLSALAIADATVPDWLSRCLMGGQPIQSDSLSENFAELGTAPTVREFVGARKAQSLDEYTLTVTNKKFEQTMRIKKDWLRFGKNMPLLEERIDERVKRWVQHWLGLFFTQVKLGETVACYDGQFFFDTDHPVGKTGSTFSNDIGVDISALPTEVHGTVSLPSPSEASLVIEKGIDQLLLMPDDQGEYINEGASSFVVMVGTTLAAPFRAALGGLRPYAADGAIESLQVAGYDITLVTSPRLSTWTDKVAVCVADSARKPIILQEVGDVEETILAEGSDLEHNTDEWEFGYLQYRGSGFGAPTSSCLVTMT